MNESREFEISKKAKYKGNVYIYVHTLVSKANLRMAGDCMACAVVAISRANTIADLHKI